MPWLSTSPIWLSRIFRGFPEPIALHAGLLEPILLVALDIGNDLSSAPHAEAGSAILLGDERERKPMRMAEEYTPSHLDRGIYNGILCRVPSANSRSSSSAIPAELLLPSFLINA